MPDRRYVSNFNDLLRRLKISQKQWREWKKEGIPAQKVRINGEHHTQYDMEAIKAWLKVEKGIEINDPPEERNEVIASCVGAGMTLQKTGEIFGLTRERVRQIIQVAGQDSEVVNLYRANRGNILAYGQLKDTALQEELRDAITPEEITRAGLKTKLEGINLLGQNKNREFEMERLERGESTENVAVLVAEIKADRRRMREGSEPGRN